MYVFLLLSALSLLTAACTTPRSLVRRLGTVALSWSLGFPPDICLAQPGVRSVAPDRTYDRTFEDQLKVISALQVEKQIDGVRERKEKDQLREKGASDSVIATGIVALPPPSGKGIDVTQYPLGYARANLLENSFEAEDAALIITAVPASGPPFAAKIVRNLNKQDFPYPFSIRTSDLIFPYTEAAWRRSPLARKSVSLTAILDPDGKLTTPDDAHFGFATSSIDTSSESSKGVTEARLDSGAGVGEGASFKRREKSGKLVAESGAESVAGDFARVDETKAEETLLPRREARVSVSLKADGNPYSASELDLLGRIDAFLADR
jgi:hypothetical protein